MDTATLIREFTFLVGRFRDDKAWGEIRITFQDGNPNAISNTVTAKVLGTDQAKVVYGGRPHGTEYRKSNS